MKVSWQLKELLSFYLEEMAPPPRLPLASRSSAANMQVRWRVSREKLAVRLRHTFVDTDQSCVLFLHKETSSSIYKPCSRSSDQRTTSNWCVNTLTHTKLNLKVVDRLSRRSTLFYLIDPGGPVGERQRSDHPLHGGGLDQRAAGHGGERGAGNGLQSCW